MRWHLVELLSFWQIVDESGAPVAIIHKRQHELSGRETRGRSEAELKKIAQVIAAAPAALEVCRLIVKEWESDHTHELRGTLIARLTQYADVARSTLNRLDA